MRALLLNFLWAGAPNCVVKRPRPPVERSLDPDAAALADMQLATESILEDEPPDLHTQLESIFHAVHRAEAEARLDDRIDLSLGIRQANQRL